MEDETFDERKLKEHFYDLTIDTILKECEKNLHFVKKDDSINDVLFNLKEKKHVWVVDNKKNKNVLGIITRLDLLHLLAPPKSFYHIFSLPESYHYGTVGEAEDIMNKHFISCSSSDKIVGILEKMIRHSTDKIAITSKKDIIKGEINLKQLIHYYYSIKKNHE